MGNVVAFEQKKQDLLSVEDWTWSDLQLFWETLQREFGAEAAWKAVFGLGNFVGWSDKATTLFRFSGSNPSFGGVVAATSFEDAMEKVRRKIVAMGHDEFTPFSIFPCNADIVLDK